MCGFAFDLYLEQDLLSLLTLNLTMDLVQADVVHIHISPEDKMPLYLEHRYVVCFPPLKCKSSVLSLVTSNQF